MIISTDTEKGFNKIYHPFFKYLVFNHFLHLFILERGEGRENERERNTNVQEIHQSVASLMPLSRDLAHNPSMCPDW